MAIKKIKIFLVKSFPNLRSFFLALNYQFLKLKAYFISDEKYIKSKFLKSFGQIPNLVSPKRYNEHILKILLTPPSDLVQKCTDKHLVRDYVKMKVGDEILVENLGVYYNTKELEQAWKSLPNRFVLRASHGSGWNYICKNKEETDFQQVKQMVKFWFKSDYYYYYRELGYKGLTPKIVCDKYIEDESGGLIDYKFNCFHGEPKFINVLIDRSSSLKLHTFDIDWNYIDINFFKFIIQDPDEKFEKPKVFDKMVEYSRILSKDFDYVRVDFYIVDDQIYFGELTFTGGNGAFEFTEEQDLFFGKYFDD